MKISPNRKRSLILIAIAVILAAVAVLSISTLIIKVNREKNELAGYEAEYEKLTGENDVARKKLEALQNEDDTSYYVDFYDDVAHDNGYVHPDEEIYVRDGN